VAALGKSAGGLEYSKVGTPDQDLIPSAGTLRVVVYDRARILSTRVYGYTLPGISGQDAYGSEAGVTFADGSRLYASYVSPSLYRVELFTTPTVVDQARSSGGGSGAGGSEGSGPEGVGSSPLGRTSLGCDARSMKKKQRK